MTSRDFAYWLQGLFELGSPESLDAKQTALIKAHLAMVFAHEIDPSMGSPAHQEKLSALHPENPVSLTVKDPVSLTVKPGGARLHFDPNPKIMC